MEHRGIRRQFTGQLLREFLERRARSGQHAHDRRRLLLLGGGSRAPESNDVRSRDLAQEGRIAVEDRLELLARKAHELRITNCVYRRGPPLVGENRHLADQLTGADATEHGLAAVIAGNHDAEAAAHDDEHAVAVVALAEQHFPLL